MANTTRDPKTGRFGKAVQSAPTNPCAACRGTGMVARKITFASMKPTEPCPVCSGTGKAVA